MPCLNSYCEMIRFNSEATYTAFYCIIMHLNDHLYSPVNPLIPNKSKMLLDPRFISSLRSEGKMAEKSDFATRRAASREKHGPELKEIFKQVDKDNSGYASIDEMW